MTATAVSLDGDLVALDFLDPTFPTYGSDARKIEGDAALLWGGKASWALSIRYTRSYNDRDALLLAVGFEPTNTMAGYKNR